MHVPFFVVPFFRSCKRTRRASSETASRVNRGKYDRLTLLAVWIAVWSILSPQRVLRPILNWGTIQIDFLLYRWHF